MSGPVVVPRDASVYEGSGVRWMARVTGGNGANIVQADVSSIAFSVYDLADTDAATATGALSVASVVFDSLQTDARWTVDSIGYNFAWDMAYTIFEDGGTTYRVEVTFTPASGDPFHLVRDFPVVGVYRV